MIALTTRAFAGMFGLSALLMAMVATPLAGCDSDECEENTFQCEGAILSRCVSGEFEFVEDCTGKGECMPVHGHCHMEGMGGSHAGGHAAGGHAEGGHAEGGHHEGGHHEGGMAGMGGAGGN